MNYTEINKIFDTFRNAEKEFNILNEMEKTEAIKGLLKSLDKVCENCFNLIVEYIKENEKEIEDFSEDIDEYIIDNVYKDDDVSFEELYIDYKREIQHSIQLDLYNAVVDNARVTKDEKLQQFINSLPDLDLFLYLVKNF